MNKLSFKLLNTPKDSITLIGEGLGVYANPLTPGDDVCTRCGSAFSYQPYEYGSDETSTYPRDAYSVCGTCYRELLLTGTPEGRISVEHFIKQAVDPAYHDMDFIKIDVSGSYGQNIAEARDKVFSWAEGVIAGDKRPLYLFSPGGDYGSGFGNGKTSLLWSAFKHIGRRTAVFTSGARNWHFIRLTTRTVDIPAMVSDFRSKRRLLNKDQVPLYTVTYPGEQSYDGTIDQLITTAARMPVLFIDDIAQGQCGPMEQQFYEQIIDIRSRLGLPTMCTANFVIDDLGDRIGERTASRIRRGGCEIIEIQAPDYSMAKAERRSL